MKRFCNQLGQLIIGTLLILCSLPSYAEVTLNLLVRGETVPGIPDELMVSCSGDFSLDFADGGSLVFNTASDTCPNPVEEGIDFESLPEVNFPLIVNYTDVETGEVALSFSAIITNGEEHPAGDGATFNAILGGVEVEPKVDPTPPTPPTPPGDLVEENACELARDNDVGNFGVYDTADDCPDGPRLVIYDGSNSRDTSIPGCVGQPDVLSAGCKGFTSIIGHTIYAQRLDWVDLGANSEKVGFVIATTINDMIGENVSEYKNMIASVSPIPGEFNTTNNCNDITAAENATVIVVQSGSDVALENAHRYCVLTPGVRYYINSRHDEGKSINCGLDGTTCQHTLVNRVPDVK